MDLIESRFEGPAGETSTRTAVGLHIILLIWMSTAAALSGLCGYEG